MRDLATCMRRVARVLWALHVILQEVACSSSDNPETLDPKLKAQLTAVPSSLEPLLCQHIRAVGLAHRPAGAVPRTDPKTPAMVRPDDWSSSAGQLCCWI